MLFFQGGLNFALHDFNFCVNQQRCIFNNFRFVFVYFMFGQLHAITIPPTTPNHQPSVRIILDLQKACSQWKMFVHSMYYICALMIFHCSFIKPAQSVGDFKIISINNFTSTNNNIFEVFYRSYNDKKINISAEIKISLKKVFVSFHFPLPHDKLL